MKMGYGPALEGVVKDRAAKETLVRRELGEVISTSASQVKASS